MQKYVPAGSFIAVDELLKVVPKEHVPMALATKANSCAFKSIFDQNMKTL